MKKNKVVIGTFNGNPRGFGFVTPDEPDGEDIYIAATETGDALHRDKVRCVRVGRDAGYIDAVLERGFDTLAGTFFWESPSTGYVIPLERRIPYYFYIRAKAARAIGLVDGHRVMFKPLTTSQRLTGQITEVIGHMNDPGVDVLTIVRQFGVTATFPENVLAEAAALPEVVEPEALTGRADFRGLATFTIDGEDTKDIDDAISFRVVEDGVFELGVHIADVAHYVREHTPLDTEALRRGTSVYLADRVIPMLPHKLSNGICSLNPGFDRLTLSCVMRIDDSGRVLSYEMLPSVINSRKQFTYTLVNTLLTTADDGLLAMYADWMPCLRDLARLCETLKENRRLRGALAFSFPETKITVDENGWPIAIRAYESNVATEIIETCMIICNETIAEHFCQLAVPFVYRTHEEPDGEKLRSLGYSANPKRLQALLTAIKGTPTEAAVGYAVLRCMKQARYTCDNTGHFGLASPFYCHFTSPIRRYPDLQIHRIIKLCLTGMTTETQKRLTQIEAILPDVRTKCSAAERTAESLEREVVQLKKVQYMQGKEGEIYDGVVSGLVSWGVFVMLPDTVEGLVAFEDMTDDHYRFLPEQMAVVGQRKKKTIHIGDKVIVRLKSVSVSDKRITFRFVKKHPG